ncbi:hypothetical protein Tco_1351783 [Tanacetum coccineum]
MTMCAQPVMSPGHSARVTEAMALSDSAFRKRYRSSYETPSPSPTLLGEDIDEDEGDESLDVDNDEDRGLDDDGRGLDDDDRRLDDDDRGLDDEDRGLDDEGREVESDGLGIEGEEATPDGQQWAAPVMETATSEPLRLGYGALRRQELAAEDDQVRNTFEVGQGSGSAPELERPERVSALRQPTLTTWTDPKDAKTYIDIPTYPPLAPPVQTLPSLKWSPGSLSVSPAPSTIPSPISSPMISLTVPSPIASLVATPTAIIPVDEDQFIEIGAHLELY